MIDIDILSASKQKMAITPLPFGKQAAVNNIDYGAFFMSICQTPLPRTYQTGRHEGFLFITGTPLYQSRLPFGIRFAQPPGRLCQIQPFAYGSLFYHGVLRLSIFNAFR